MIGGTRASGARRTAGKGRSRRAEATRKSGDERWAELLQVAAKTFASKGYSATTLQGIANDLGMLKGSLYYYIRTKEDLLFEVIQAVLVLAEERLSERVPVDGPAVERLEALVREHVVFLIEHLTETTVYLHEADQLSPERRAELPVHGFIARLEGLVVEGQEDGTIRADVDPRMGALVILGSANWVYRWYRPEGDLAPEEIADEIARTCRRSVEA
ncbi:TetR/AcrR family transcriptional regulator [Streptomyces muensis]|uniref:TetR/AcrR family transcriptional regulator n=1 Tax=Streptomyces muensis TaxID=1077944 RepID=A0A9X1PUN3_STRM4|nr:TetR/AcrR family transcriptional regulator [Streptomyces muensis]MCF1592589.1 TetR/AcrR family transcriptional regulator [Streptomyces muensis]